ncbi:hypothetical protein DFH08DRAFT_1042784 [Mycena albidolilacea]|uniref:Uncharacterized protein n=1 Tax=Mycena albidolilacea TaxID=1033008 RepID=A0AAD7AG89_9AGAR|nr:hypothetical protein DFH08DRAFT_1042784 [Mycena albidolilacea]
MAKHKQQGSSKGEMQHQMEREIFNRQSISSKASPQALVMLGKAGMRSVERQACTAGMVAVKTILDRMQGGHGEHRSISQKASPTPAARLARTPAHPWFLVCPHHAGLPRDAPAFAVLGSAAHLRVPHHPILLPLVICAPSPAGPQFEFARRLTTANHSAIRSATHALARRTSHSTLHPVYSNSRTTPACTTHSAGALPHFELAHPHAPCPLCAPLACTYIPPYTPILPPSQRITSCSYVPQPPPTCAPMANTDTLPLHASIMLAFAPCSTCDVHLPAAAAPAQMSCVHTFVHAQCSHTPLAPWPWACDRMRAECRHYLAWLPSTLLHPGAPHCDDVVIHMHWISLDVVEPLVARRRLGCRTPLDLLVCALLERSLHPRALLLHGAEQTTPPHPARAFPLAHIVEGSILA